MASLPAETFDLCGRNAGECSPAPDAKNLSRAVSRQILAHLSSKLIVLLGLALFGCAMMVAFRVVALDAAHQLQQPAIDFALCGALGFLGLSISWVHLGNKPATEPASAFEDDRPAVSESVMPTMALASSPAAWGTPPLSSAPAPAVSTSRAARKPMRGLWPGTRRCPFCGQKMAHVGPEQYQCRICRHVENPAPTSFLDAAVGCSCTHCGQDVPHAG